jgi:hypothetical protein
MSRRLVVIVAADLAGSRRYGLESRRSREVTVLSVPVEPCCLGLPEVRQCRVRLLLVTMCCAIMGRRTGGQIINNFKIENVKPAAHENAQRHRHNFLVTVGY